MNEQAVAEIRAWKKRWELVNQREIEELRAMSPEAKLRQLEALMRSVDQMGWREQLEEGVEEVRERWNKLRRIYGERRDD